MRPKTSIVMHNVALGSAGKMFSSNYLQKHSCFGTIDTFRYSHSLQLNASMLYIKAIKFKKNQILLNFIK